MGLSDRWDQTPPKVHSSGGVTGIPGGPQTVAYLGYLPPQIMELALQCALLTESSAQGSFLGIEKSLQSLPTSWSTLHCSSSHFRQSSGGHVYAMGMV